MRKLKERSDMMLEWETCRSVNGERWVRSSGVSYACQTYVMRRTSSWPGDVTCVAYRSTLRSRRLVKRPCDAQVTRGMLRALFCESHRGLN